MKRPTVRLAILLAVAAAALAATTGAASAKQPCGQQVIDGRLKVVPRGVQAAGNVMVGGRGGVDLPHDDIDRVKSHLAKYYDKLGDEPPWERD